MKIFKANNQIVTKTFLKDRINRAAKKGFGKAKWIEFCEICMDSGFVVRLYEARKTYSKYITIEKEGKAFKVRFSNHKPIEARELRGDCDFFVGITNTGVRTTDHAIKATAKFFAQ